MGASPAKRAEVAERRTKAIQLRLAGVDYETIAKKLGYNSRGAAAQDVTRALQQYSAEAAASADVLREREVLILDRAQAAIWPKVLNGDLRAVEQLIRIIERRCRIQGIDAPQRIEYVTIDLIEAEIARLENELGITTAGREVLSNVPKMIEG